MGESAISAGQARRTRLSLYIGFLSPPAYHEEVNHMASLHDLARLGQSVWLDFIDRNLVADGGLQRLVDGGLTGVTTNPTIFHKAIGAGRDYDETIRELLE